MENVIISNPEDFERKKGLFMEAKDNLQIVSDFDGTLSKFFVDGEKVPSIISQIRDGTYLTPEYAKKAQELYRKYHAIEKNPDMTIEEKIPYMEEWWRTHYEILINLGLNKKDIYRVVKEGKVRLREGVIKFLDLLEKNGVPLVILSASGLGDAIPLFFRKEGRNYKNVHIIGNFFNYTESGEVISIKGPLIHSMNKHQVELKGRQIYQKLETRKNVLLLGNSLGDVGMIEGFPYENLIKIGFLNEEVESNLEKFKENFDAVITNDGDFEFVNSLVEEIIN